MLSITITPPELWDENKSEFITIPPRTIQLEHSLVSISKWESKWEKPFIDSKKTLEETIDYIRCMTITQNVNPNIYDYLSDENIQTITDYVNKPMTATTFRNTSKGRKEIVTSELIYYWMFTYSIPLECQKWHLNRLLTLIRLCNTKNTPPKKRSEREILEEYKAISDARCKQWNTRG